MTWTRLAKCLELVLNNLKNICQSAQDFFINADSLSMKNHLVIASFLFSGCVTVDVAPKKSEPAQNVIYVDPASPFKSSPNKSTDRLWISTTSGNTISYLSECGNSQEPTLEQLENDALGGLVELKILHSEKIDYNSREALKTLAEGKVDGVKVKMNLLTLKKNNCNYTLVYGGVSKNFDAEQAYFQTFLGGFKAP